MNGSNYAHHGLAQLPRRHWLASLCSVQSVCKTHYDAEFRIHENTE